MALGIGDFEGHWAIRRDIEDRLVGQTGEFRGSAVLRDGGDGHWLWHETGVMHLGDGTPFTAERRYRWRADGAGIEVLFDDGRPFHRFDPGGAPQVAHWCNPDDYRVRYDFGGWPDWRAEWTVSGPRKDYTMISRYSR